MNVPRPSALALCLGWLVGCAGDIGGDPSALCLDGNSPPAAAVVDPAPSVDVVPGDLRLRASGYQDVEGDEHVASEWEIWRVAGDQAVDKVWHAAVSAPADLASAALVDGEFVVGDGLEPGARYEAKVRFRAGAGCNPFGEWSPGHRFTTDDGSSYFFADGATRDVELDVPDETWAAIDAEARPPGCVPFVRESHPATLRFEGATYADVGLKLKGGCGSARGMDGKPSFKVDIQWDDPAAGVCAAKRRILGLSHLTLNNDVQDPSYVHQHLAYALYRAMGVPAPRAGFVRVRVNGEAFGLYTHVETADRRLLSRWFDSNDGMMYEGTYFCDLVPQNVPPRDDYPSDVDYCLGREFDTDACSSPAPDADPTDYRLIRALVTQVDAVDATGDFYPAISQFIDFDTFLSMWAVDAIINHWDGFVYRVMNNYRLYHDPSSDLWTVLPSGTDQTFTFSELRSAFSVNNILARRCLAEDDCAAAFVARLRQALDVYAALDLPSMALALRAQIADDVMADPRREFGYQTFEDAVATTIQFLEGRRAVIEQDLAAHGY